MSCIHPRERLYTRPNRSQHTRLNSHGGWELRATFGPSGVSGRKTDVADCQWIQYLHSVGLLRQSFRPPAVICAIRSHWRQRLPRRCGRLRLTNCPVGRIVRAGRPFPHTSNLSLNLAGAVSAPCKLAGGPISLGPRNQLSQKFALATSYYRQCEGKMCPTSVALEGIRKLI